MSNLPGNPYAEEIDKALGTQAVIDPEAFALMALAFEHRTANLIAMIGKRHADGGSAITEELSDHLLLTTSARLGLDKS